MPKYKKRDPEYTAVHFNGSNIREVMDELGPEFSTIYDLDIKGATDFVLKGRGGSGTVHSGDWVLVDPELRGFFVHEDSEFKERFEPVKRVGRPPKSKEKK